MAGKTVVINSKPWPAVTNGAIAGPKTPTATTKKDGAKDPEKPTIR